VLWAYEPEPSLDNGSVMGTHCVYNTIKPKCVSISKGTMHFVKEMRATCQEEIFEGNCLDQCARFFCSSDYDKDGGGGNVNGKDACGKDDIGVSLDGAKGQDGAMAKSPGAFDRCANCCGRLSIHEGWSSCLTRRRRRRLREATSQHKAHRAHRGAKAFNIEDEEDYKYSKHECAESCLLTEGCIAWDVREGACIISKHCDATAGEGNGYRTGKWMVKKGVTREEMGMEPHGTPKKKRVRKNKPKPPMPADFNEIMDVAVIAQDLVDDPTTEGHDMGQLTAADEQAEIDAGEEAQRTAAAEGAGMEV